MMLFSSFASSSIFRTSGLMRSSANALHESRNNSSSSDKTVRGMLITQHLVGPARPLGKSRIITAIASVYNDLNYGGTLARYRAWAWTRPSTPEDGPHHHVDISNCRIYRSP